MRRTKGRVLSISDTAIVVEGLKPPWSGRQFELPYRNDLEIGQFVDFVIHPNDVDAGWLSR